MRAGTPFQEFQEYQEFQAFQEIATHFKSVSRDSKSYQEFQEFQEHVSRGGYGIRFVGFKPRAGMNFADRILKSNFKRFKSFKSIKSFKRFKRQQHISRVFQEIARVIKSFNSFKSTFQEWLTKHDLFCLPNLAGAGYCPTRGIAQCQFCCSHCSLNNRSGASTTASSRRWWSLPVGRKS